MKVLVLGASGKTGGLVTERALAQGFEVTVLLRDPFAIQAERRA